MEFIDKDKYKNLSGIYIIENKINEMVYAGQTTNTFEKRFYKHLAALRHHQEQENRNLVKDYNKYGEENFYFKVIEVITYDWSDKINLREEYWVNYYMSQNRAYNIFPGGSNWASVKIKNHFNSLGRKASTETREKLSDQQKSKRVNLLDDKTKQLIINIKKDFMSGMNASEISRKYNVSRKNVSNILVKNTYPSITVDGWEEFQSNRKKQLTDADAEDIRKLYIEGYKVKDLAKQYECTEQNIRDIVKCKSHKPKK